MPHAARSLAAALLLAAGSAYAHDFWIEPSKFVVEVGESVTLRLREGEALLGNSLPYIDEWFRDFSQSDARGRISIVSEMGNDPAAVIRIRRGGTTLLGYRSAGNFVVLEPDKFENYLRMEGMEFVLALRARLGETERAARENFVRCAKTYLTTDGRVLEQALQQPLGYTLELMPAANLASLAPGEVLGVQLLYLGKPLAGALVVAFRGQTPQAKQRARTDADGRAQLTLDAPGVWLVKAVHMTRLERHPKADWESYWASLLFEVPARGDFRAR